MVIKAARAIIPSNITVLISKIIFDSNKMSNIIKWTVDNPNNEKILSFDVILFQNDTSLENGSIKNVFEVGPDTNQYVHKNIEIIANGRFFRSYSYQIICYTDIASKASQIEKWDSREIYEVEPPKQITFSIKNGHIYFSIMCDDTNKFSTNIFIFKKDFDNDVFERIAVLPYRNNTLFVDKNVTLGHFYEYRFMTYDLFGHFSQKIVKIDVRIWDSNYHTSKKNTLFDPIPFAEYAQESTKKPLVKVKIANLDPRCPWYTIRRRDISEKRQSFESVPVGFLLKNVDNNEIEFTDSIVRSDSYYQYSIVGQDKYGNNTDIRQSNVVFTKFTDALPAMPVSLTTELITTYPTAVRLSWVDDNLNQKLSDVVSGSSPLFPKDNLYYFKAFRRAYNELNYQSFPEQSSSFLVDSCKNDGVVINTDYPSYKPEPPIRDTKYYYYIATYDSTTNVVSNRSPEILVDFTVPPTDIFDLEVFYNSVFEPLKCLIRWKINESEKTLDLFSVERIEEDGVWNKIGNSYFNTQFVDTTIKRGRKYLYRIAAIDFMGNMSNYSFVSLTT
jgi:hypothetical protein